MEPQFQIQDGVLAIAGTLDLDAAETLRDSLLQVLEASSHPQLDLSLVEGCDLASLQLIRSAFRTAQGLGVALKLKAPSTALTVVCRETGVAMEDICTGGI